MLNMKNSHIIVGISGGVDSAVAAYLLKEAGHKIEGVFMKNWEGDDTEHDCHDAIHLADAEVICDQLKIDLQVVNFSDRYWQHVFSYFLDEYRAGRTPNPDVLCNKEIKFKAFLDYAKGRGAHKIATGHYARLQPHHTHINLLKGTDLSKDQSYFLHLLNQSQLAHSLFPVGHLKKQEVRHLAKAIGLKNHAKKDSTGICFIGERPFKTFLNHYLPSQSGMIETLQGEVIGQHDGLMFYTIGQRKGLNIGGLKGKAELPWYVAQKDLKRNVLTVVQDEMHPALFKKELIASNLHFIQMRPTFPFKTFAKIRYRQHDQACLLEEMTNKQYRVIFDKPQRAITPGQAIVFYQDDICLGGGMIES